MASANTFRPYSGKLLPNERKAPMVVETLNWLDRAYGSFFDLFVGLWGGIQHNDIASLLEQADDKETDVDLLLAVHWFRVVPKSQQNSALDAVENRVALFRQYAGHAPSPLALEYLSGPVDASKDQWCDCRQLYHQMCEQIGANLDQDVSSLLRLKLLPVMQTQTLNAYSFCSNMFGEGQKEDSSVKARMYAHVAKELEAQKPTTHEDYRRVVSSVGDLPPQRGVDILMSDLRSTASGPIDEKYLNSRVERYAKAAAEKSQNNELPNRLRVKKFILDMVGNPYNCSVWAAPALRAASDIKSKNSNNYRFAVERFDRQKMIDDLAKVPLIRGAQDVLREFRKGEFNEFVVEKRHLGKSLPTLFDMWTSMNCAEGIAEYQTSLKDNYDRQPIAELLELVYPHRHSVSADVFLQAAELNKLENTHATRRVHPTVHGKVVINFGTNSTIFGSITPPEKLLKFRGQIVPAGQTGMIWFTMCLIDNGKWTKHHIPTHCTRYFEEIYAYREGLPVLPEPRRAIYGHRIGNKISDTSKIDPRRRKASKQYLRTLENMTHNVEFDPTTQFMVDGDLNVTITARVAKLTTSRDLNVGTRIMAVNKNQTIRDSYTIWECVPHGTDNSFRHTQADCSLKLVADGHITSMVNGSIDQLSYSGPDAAKCEGWIQQRSAFVESVDDEEGNYMKKFVGITQVKLYSWNLQYSKFLAQLIKDRMTNKNCASFRNEIVSFISGRFGCRLGSLTQTSLSLITKMKSVISQYFNRNQKFTIEEQTEFDKEMFDLLNVLEQKRINKRKEKVNRTISSILQLAKLNGVGKLVMVNSLPVATKEAKPETNQRAVDWCARQVQQKIADQANAVGIFCDFILGFDVSHMDPFVFISGTDTGKQPQFDEVDRDNINSTHVAKFADWHGQLSVHKTTTSVYHRGLRAFASHYGLNFDSLPKIKHSKLSEVLPNGKVLIPYRGGRWFLSTYPVTTHARRVTWNGETKYLNWGDMVAPVNIMLMSFRPSRRS